MLIGILTSSIYDKSQRVSLPLDTKMQVMGYDLVYKGKVDASDGKDKVRLKLNGEKMNAKYYWSDYSRAYMISPAVKNSLLRDIYISPIKILKPEEVAASDQSLVLNKNEKTSFRDLLFEFVEYDMSNHQMTGGDIQLAAVINIYDADGNFLESLKPVLKVSGKNRSLVPAVLSASGDKVNIKSVDANNQSIALSILDSSSDDIYSGKEILAAEVSIKPLIIILWLGTILLMAGLSMSLYQQSRNSKN